MTEINIRNQGHGVWAVIIDQVVISTHRGRDAAATSANNHVRAASELRGEQR